MQSVIQAEINLQAAKAEIQLATEQYLEKLVSFENRYPKIVKNIDETLYSETDLNLVDLVNLLQSLSEILG